jgi:hypothetical protein
VSTVVRTPSQGQPSGLVDLPDTGLLPLWQAQYSIVADWHGPRQPMEVGMFCKWPGSNPIASIGNSIPVAVARGEVGASSGTTTLAESWLAGGWRLTYAGGGGYKTLICDLVTQRLFLGVCDSVRVEAFRWRQTAWAAIAPTISAGADIGPSNGGAYDEPTCTQQIAIAAGIAANQPIPVPTAARYFSPLVALNTTSILTLWGGTNPDLYWQAGGTQVEYRIAARQITPAYPRYEVAATGSASPVTLTLHSNGVVLTSALMVGTRYYLQT